MQCRRNSYPTVATVPAILVSVLPDEKELGTNVLRNSCSDMDTAPSGYMLWLLDFARKLIGQRLMSTHEAAHTNGNIELVERRKERGQAMKQQWANDVLEGV